MKKFFPFLLVALIAALTAFFVARPAHENQTTAPTTQTTYEKVLTSGEIHCGYSLWQPLMYVDPNSGEKLGIFHDLTEELGQRLGLKIIWQEELGWATAVESIASHRVDMARAGYWLHPDRLKAASATIPLIYSALYVWARGDEERVFQNPDELNKADYNFGLIDGGSSDRILQTRFPLARVFSMPQTATNGDLIEVLLTKKADFIIDDNTSFAAYNKANPNKLKNLFPDQPMAIFPAVQLLPPDDPRFKEVVDATLRLIELDGTLDRILAKYDATDIFLKNPRPAQQTR